MGSDGLWRKNLEKKDRESTGTIFKMGDGDKLKNARIFIEGLLRNKLRT